MSIPALVEALRVATRDLYQSLSLTEQVSANWTAIYSAHAAYAVTGSGSLLDGIIEAHRALSESSLWRETAEWGAHDVARMALVEAVAGDREARSAFLQALMEVV